VAEGTACGLSLNKRSVVGNH